MRRLHKLARRRSGSVVVGLVWAVGAVALCGCNKSADSAKGEPPSASKPVAASKPTASTGTGTGIDSTPAKTVLAAPVDLKTALLGVWVSPEGMTVLKDFREAALEFKADGTLRGETDGAYSLENKDDPKKSTLLPLKEKVSYTGQYTLTGNTLTISWDKLGESLFLDSLYRPATGQWVIEVVTPTQLVLKQLNSPEDSIQKTWLLSTWRRPSDKS